MAEATPTPGETGTPATPQTTPTPPAAPPAQPPQENAVETALRKELEQAKMRANQLENEKKTRDDAEAKAKDEELEKQNQFKSLYEQEKAKREAAETEIEEKERTKALNEAKATALSEYPDEVKALVEETGLNLTDTTDTAVEAFKSKLEKIAKTVGAQKVQGNNPSPKVPGSPELTPDQLRETLRDPNKFHEYMVNKYKGIAIMTSQPKQ